MTGARSGCAFLKCRLDVQLRGAGVGVGARWRAVKLAWRWCGVQYGGYMIWDGARCAGGPKCIDSADLGAQAVRWARWAWRKRSARSFCLSVWGSWSVWSNVRWARGRVLVEYWAHHRCYGTESACGIMDGVRRAQAWVSAQGGGAV